MGLFFAYTRLAGRLPQVAWLDYAFLRMAAGLHRAMRWTVVVTLAAALLSAIASAVAARSGCSGGVCGNVAGASHCQWVIPAACCDDALAVAGSASAALKPVGSIAFFALPHSLRLPETPPWTVGHVSISPQRVYLATVVLLL